MRKALGPSDGMTQRQPAASGQEGRRDEAKGMAAVSRGWVPDVAGSVRMAAQRQVIQRAAAAPPDPERLFSSLPESEPGKSDPKATEPGAPGDTKPPTSREAQIEATAAEARLQIQAAFDRSEDTHALSRELKEIQARLSLREIHMADLGTPKAAVRFQVNPWFSEKIPSGKILWRMLGRGPKPISQVDWTSESLTVGTGSAVVGKHMIAKPLASDHEPGSTSANDKDQDDLMRQFANAGTTSVPNDQKYIKGHLLNDHVGGAGAYFNLFPITADANAKHLAYVEKFVKAQLAGAYVINYEIKVDNVSVVDLHKNGKAPYSIDADFSFYWTLLDTAAQPFKTAHGGKIESRYNTKGAEPFDVTTEYVGEYDKVNYGKSTPKAIGQVGQWQLSGVSQPGMVSVGVPTHSQATLQFPTGFLGGGSSSVTAPAPLDFTDIQVKEDASGVEYISVRNANAPPLTAVGSLLTVGPSSKPVSTVIKSISPMGGGWTRIYF